MRKNWDATRAALDAAAEGEPHPDRDAQARRKEAKHCADLIRQSGEALAAWRQWPEIMHRRLAERLLCGVVWRRKIKPALPSERRASDVAHWAEQLRAVEAEVRFELSLERSEDRILTHSRRALESLNEEHRSLLAELDGFIRWLRQRLAGHERKDVPPPQTDVVPASSRLADFAAELKGVPETLPESVQILTKFSALPRRWGKPKELQPRETFSEAFTRTGQGRLAGLLAEIEAEHHRIVREIERAREVVSFGLGEASAGQEIDPQIAREALQNALSLLEFNRGEARDWRPEAEARMVQALAAVFAEDHLILSRNRLGVFAYLGQQGARRAIVIIARNAIAAGGRAFRLARTALARLSEEALIYIGWIPEPVTGTSEVITRPFLPQEFAADLSAKELPAIYRRLFRFEAVQDPRFLVGREREMKAIAQARSLWEAGRPVAVLIIGERGSGKTSLINCALKRPLEGLEVVRSEFNQRLANREQLRAFLAQMLGLDGAANLERVLAERRRVIILEELERTFLRQIGYYAPLRELQRLIAATCASMLWIVVTN